MKSIISHNYNIYRSSTASAFSGFTVVDTAREPSPPSAPLSRDGDGDGDGDSSGNGRLAMSSRNVYLTPVERKVNGRANGRVDGRVEGKVSIPPPLLHHSLRM